ncbi:MAG: hypothetical protein DHS20C05_16760 [Hyphococcus sp.]|nr:MAG: hypothetical protein DHS20C05_16760 [Marinicaulis sp.]
MKLKSHSEGSLIADYASHMGEALWRRRAELEVRTARAEAEVAIKTRSEFLANMNHELRTPLNAIIGFATMLRDRETYSLDQDQEDTYYDYILQSADLLLGHINTILEVSALESGAVEMRDDLLNFSEVLDGAIERIQVRAKAAGVVIERRDAGEEVPAWGDFERTGQAVDHLLQAAINACSASAKEGGRIIMRACLDEHGLPEIAVRDDGEGLTQEEIEEAVEAFQDTHRGLDRSFSGPGVGYAVAKTFIEMQGGQFRIKSRKGQGTLVRIALPLPEGKSQTAPGAQQSAAADVAVSGDDDFTMERDDDAA